MADEGSGKMGLKDWFELFRPRTGATGLQVSLTLQKLLLLMFQYYHIIVTWSQCVM